MKPATLSKKETLVQVFSCECCKISKSTFSYRKYGGCCFCNSTFLIMKSCSKSAAEKQGKICGSLRNGVGVGGGRVEWGEGGVLVKQVVLVG